MRDEDLIRADGHAAALVVAGDSLAGKVVALVLGIALEGLFDAQLVGALLERFDDDRRQRQGDVADTELDDLFIGVRLDVGVGAGGDLRKEIAGHQIIVIVIDFHSFTFRACRFGTFIF